MPVIKLQHHKHLIITTYHNTAELL